jgi:alcohol dehydrogenase
MEYNLDVVISRYADVARAMGIGNGVAEPRLLAGEAIGKVRRLLGEMKLPDRLSKVGVTADKLPALAANALLDHCHRTNPKPCDRSAMQQILERAF